MGGLLDFLTGDDAQLGLGLLAAGGPSTVPMNFGQRLSAGVGQAQAAKDARMRRKLLESQVAENASQEEARRQATELAKQKQSILQAWINGESGSGGGGAVGSAPNMQAGPTGGDIALGGGLLGAPGGAIASGASPVPQRRAGPDFSPATLARLKVAGVDMTDVAKLAQPNWVENKQTGAMFDANNPSDPNRPGGSTIRRIMTPDGKAMWQNTQTGEVGIEPGSLGAFGAFQDRGNRSAATYQGEEVYDTDRNSPTYGTMVRKSKADIYGGGQGGGAAPPPRAPLIGPGVGPGQREVVGNGGGPVNGQPIDNPMRPRSTDTDMPYIYTRAMQDAQAQLRDAQSKGDAAGVMRAQNDMAGIAREAQKIGVNLQAPPAAAPAPLIGPGAGRGGQGVPMVPPAPIAAPGPAPMAPAGMPDAPGANVSQLSPSMVAANEAAKAAQVTAATEAAKNAAANQNARNAAENAGLKQGAEAKASADVVRDTAAQASAKQFDKMQATAAEAFALLKGPTTGSLPGAIRDTVTNAAGMSTTKAQNAERLEALSKWMTQNVPRMEGPQSDGDRKEYAAAAGNVGDRTKPASVRAAALETIMGLQSKYADLNKGATASAAPSAGGGKVFDALPPAASHKGATIRDTVTGKRLVSDGLSWQPAKE